MVRGGLCGPSFQQNVENAPIYLSINEMIFFHNFLECGKPLVENFSNYHQIHERLLVVPGVSH